MVNPVLVEVSRGGIVESRHTGAFAVVDSSGKTLSARGDIDLAIFPRSAIKAFQCLPVVESGAADEYGFSDAEIALACASHSGEAEHIRLARSMLAKAGNREDDYECGAHWPQATEAFHHLIRAGAQPSPVHNNCSGKHAAMLALARKLGVDTRGYTSREHPVQRAIARTISALCEVDADALACGIDGCSVPTWAIPIRKLALGFARFGSGDGLPEARRTAAARITGAVRDFPFMVAGTDRYCTKLMQMVPRAFVKTGAEGVFCSAVPHAGLGIALKCDDGANRASEVLMAAILAGLPVWSELEYDALRFFSHADLWNWRKLRVGEIRVVDMELQGKGAHAPESISSI
jgi:L-asparaginase II